MPLQDYNSTQANPITDKHLKQFHEQGFFVLESVIPETHQQMLKDVCERMMAQADAKSEADGTPKTLKYFLSLWDEPEGQNPEKDACRAQAKAFIFSDLMAHITKNATRRYCLSIL